jgi:hypothetical protein
MAHSSTAVRLSVVPLLAASFLAGCGDDEETAYCVDQNDQVTENRYCDDEYDGHSNAGVFFWYFGATGSGIRRGTRVSGGERVSASDRAALAKRGGFGSRSSRSGGIGKSASSGGGGRSGGG